MISTMFPFTRPWRWKNRLVRMRRLIRLLVGIQAVYAQRNAAVAEAHGGEEIDFSDEQPPDLKKLRSLDPETITQIHRLYFADVYRYARYRLSEDTRAEDIASETFIQLLEAVHRGKGPRTSIRGWLMRTTSNLVNNYYRKKYVDRNTELTDDIPSAAKSPDELAEENERGKVLQEAMKKLTPDQQNVLALRFGSGFSLAETAAVMEKKANAIKALQFRALAALSRHLGDRV